jgi:hypothetical protein
MIRIAGMVALAALLTGCSTLPAPPADLGEGEIFAVGLYRYDHGDRLRWRCTGIAWCEDVLVRDATLDRFIEQRRIGVRRIVVIARRVEACGPESDAVACVWAGSDTALRVVRWIEPKG